MSKLTHSQSNTNLIMLCPYMNRFANSSFSNSNRTFSSASGFSNPGGLYGRTRSLIIKPLLSNAATMSICSRCDSITCDTETSSNLNQNNINNSTLNNNESTNNDATIHNDDHSSHQHNRTISNTTFDQQQELHEEAVAPNEEEVYRRVEPAEPTFHADHEPTMSTQSYSNQNHQHSLNESFSLLSNSKPSTRPLSRRLSQHLIYPLVSTSTATVQHSASNLNLNHSRPQAPAAHAQQKQPKKNLNPVIALIAHDLLKFMEEENHYRKARENLKSDVEKIRKSRHSSAVRHKTNYDNQPTMTMQSQVSNNSSVYYSNNNKANNSLTMSSTKQRARSSMPAYRNSYSNASLAKVYSNTNYPSFNSNSKQNVNSTSTSHHHHQVSKAAHASKPAPPPVHASTSVSAVNTNELIDKLILQVYAQK